MISLFPTSPHPSRPTGVGPLALIRNAEANFPVRRSFSKGGCTMKISEDVRQYREQQCFADVEALAKGLTKSPRNLRKRVPRYTFAPNSFIVAP